MDAAHTQDATADYIHRVRDAGHIMTVKGNRPHLLEAIAARLPRASTRSADHTDAEIAGGQRLMALSEIGSGTNLVIACAGGVSGSAPRAGSRPREGLTVMCDVGPGVRMSELRRRTVSQQ
jgi:hypothetical protein